MPISFKKSIAAPKPIAPAIIGVPPSNFHGSSFHVESYKFTKSIISPPNSTGSIASSISRLPYNTQYLLVRTFYDRKMCKSHNPVLLHLLSYVEHLEHRLQR